MWPNACCLSPPSAMYHGRAVGQAAGALTGMCMQALGTQVHCCVVRGCRPKCLCTGHARVLVKLHAPLAAWSAMCLSRVSWADDRARAQVQRLGLQARHGRLARARAQLRRAAQRVCGAAGRRRGARARTVARPEQRARGSAASQWRRRRRGRWKEREEEEEDGGDAVAGGSTGAGGGGAAASGPGAVKRKKGRHAAAEGGAVGTGGLESSSPAAGQAEMEEGAGKGRAAVPVGGSKGAIAKPGGALDDAMAALGMPCSKAVHQSQSYLSFCDGQLLAVRCACAD